MDEPTKSTAETGKLLSVLRPICEALDGKLSKSPSLDDNEIVDILNQKHSTDWQKYRNRIIEITNRLEGGRPKMNAEELNALEDVADAIDIECAFLFRRMSAGR